MASNQKITAKQIRFAETVASGSTLAGAYRLAYEAENMKDSTVHANACRLAVNSKVRARIEKEQKRIEARRHADEVSDRELVIRKLKTMMDNAEAEAVQLQAAVWLGKSAAAFTDVVETGERKRSPAEVEAEIERRLAALDSTKH